MIDEIKKWFCDAVRFLRDCDMLPKAMKNLLARMGVGESKKYSPIKSLPKGPGRSAWIKYMEIMIDIFIPFTVVLGIALGGAFSMILPAGVVLMVAILAALVLLVVFCQRQRTAENFLLGSQGERMTAFWLDRVGRDDWRVFHDFQIAEGKPNIDHIVVCLKGVFCIETKMLRKEHEKNETVHFDGEKIFRGNYQLDNPDPVGQVEKNAKTLSEFIYRETKVTDDFIKKIVIFPEWFVTEEKELRDIMVTNPKRLLQRLKEKEDIMPRDQFVKIAKAIESKNKFRVDE